MFCFFTYILSQHNKSFFDVLVDQIVYRIARFNYFCRLIRNTFKSDFANGQQTKNMSIFGVFIVRRRCFDELTIRIVLLTFMTNKYILYFYTTFDFKDNKFPYKTYVYMLHSLSRAS